MMTASFRALGYLACLSISAMVIVGCGPISAHGVIRDARVAVEAAEAAGAVDGAPYEYYSALAYLKKAREEEGYSDYQAAVDLANQAKVFADTARSKAEAGGDPDQRIDPKRAKSAAKVQGGGQ